ncbi:TonB-dependent receptor [Ideonella sp.]|uniref:TonB-dependent receptor n=1 Tax=Ideonella sp. TaxID=1929293 RepID=UPI0035B1906D
MFQRTKLCASMLLAFGSGLAMVSFPALSQTEPQAERTDRVEVTGSRIKRVDAEGSLPVTTFSRADLEASGATTVAEFVRSMPFAQAGNYRPQSGSSWPGFAGADLRGLGGERTLVLIDGKRVPKAAQVGSAADMNSIPMAAVERVEILLDGASAIYGSDAIGGVMNFITRKDFQGAEFSMGYTDPVTAGGEKQELSAVVGMTGDKGRVIGGFSRTKRGMVYTNQRPWGKQLGATVYGNNAYVLSTGQYVPLPGPDGTCESIGANFYTDANGLCAFNFNAVAADEQEIETSSIFVRGEYQFAPDWSAYVNTSVSRVDSFGRYAPVPGAVFLGADSPGNPLGEDIYLLHRYAAAGNRDDYSTTSVYDFGVGVRGVVMGKIDVDFGVRAYESAFRRLGYNYIVATQAAAAIDSGAYNPTDPYSASEDTLNAMKATISRDGIYSNQEVYASASMPLFKMGGGDAQGFVGVEYREERYSDQYDSLSEAGQILGSSGNSAGGGREVTAVSGELLFPISKALEASLSARYEEYSDYGSDFSPKASVKFKPMSNLALRASVGTGFRAPSIDILTQKTTFSAETIEDERTCAVLPCNNGSIQRDTYFTANPELESEKSNQFSVGAVWDITPAVSFKVDYWALKIKDVIGQVSAQEIVDRDNGIDPRPIPDGLGLTRAPSGAITEIRAGYANEGTLKTSGLDMNITGRWKAGGFGEFNHSLTWAHMLEYDQDGDDTVGDQGLPTDRITLANRWSMGDFDVSWNVNYIGQNGEDSPTVKRDTDPYTTHDLQLNYSPSFLKGAKFTIGAINVTDEQPQQIRYDGRPFNFNLYDSYGRQAYVRVTQKF